MLKIGMLIDNRYKILSIIGRGGTSCVFLAENIRLRNQWAIKEVYKNGVMGNVIESNQLIAESDILTKLRHPGLPTIIDIIETAESYLIVMEYVEGISLDRLLAERGVQSQEDVIKWSEQLCDVLHYLHTRQPAIIYRDMKPANIMLKSDGNVVLIDFGMARKFNRHTNRDTTNLGTHGYAAPEQYRNTQQTDARTDIYSLGVTIYTLVTGQDPCLPPYGIRPIRSVNPSLSPKLEQIIQKCTQLEPENRYQSVLELKNDLKLISDNSYIFDEPEKPSHKSSGAVLAAIIIPIVFVLIAIIAIVLIMGNGDKDGNDASVSTQQEDIAYKRNLIGINGCVLESTVKVADERIYYSFEPEVSGMYCFYSVSDEVLPVGWLYDSEDELLESDNTTGDYTGFEMYCWMEAGELYVLETTLYDLDEDVSPTGTYQVCVEYVGV